MQKTNFNEAEKWLKKAIEINKRLNQQQELVYNYAYLALLHQRKYDFVNATNYFFESIELAKKYQNHSIMQRNYCGISMLYCDQDDFKKALVYAKKGSNYF